MIFAIGSVLSVMNLCGRVEEENMSWHNEGLTDFELQTLNHSCLADVSRQQKILGSKVSFNLM